MAKLFGNIDIVQRLAASSYNRSPLQPQPVNQGSSNIRFSSAVIGKESIFVNTTSYIDQFTSNIVVPVINPLFRKTISLEDRLKQSSLGSTNHLPQFFLSDVFTDYIKVKPFGIFEHTSDLIIAPFLFTPIQGATTPTPFSFSNTGLITIQGVLQSTTQVVLPNPDVLTLFSPTIILPPEPGSLAQGGLNFTLAAPADSFAQGATNPTTSAPEGSFEQGGTTIAITYSRAQTEQQVIELHGSTILPVTDFQNSLQVEQGSTTPTPFNFQPNRTSPTLNVLGYQLDRLLAITLPRVKHGSALLDPPPATQTIRNDENSLLSSNDYRFGQAPAGTWNDATSQNITPGTRQIDGNNSWLDLPNWLYNESGELQQVSTDINPATNQPRVIDPRTQTSRVEQTADWSDSSDSGATNANSGNLAAYKALSYGELGLRSANPTYAPTNITPSVNIKANNETQLEFNNTDFVDLIISGAGGAVRFRSYITSFNDSFNVNWTDINYVGRQDTMKAYKGTTRSTSLGFKVAAFSKTDLITIYDKLNRLINSVAIGRPTLSIDYISSPVAYLTVGKWFSNTACVVNSIKFDTQPTEYSWDIGQPRDRSNKPLPSPNGDDEVDSPQMPMIVDIAMEFSILGDANNRVLNGASNKHFAYLI